MNQRRKKKHHPKRNGDPSPSDSSGKSDGSSSFDEPTESLKTASIIALNYKRLMD